MTDARLDDAPALCPDPERVIATAMAMCAHDSGNGREADVAATLAERLALPGVAVELHEVLPGRPNLLATLDTGRPGPTLLFNGHLDTLPAPTEHYSHDPFRPFCRDGRVFGAEINNMRGAVAAMAGALAVLAERRDTLSGRIVLSAVMSECDSLGHGTLSLLESGFTADFCINGEPTDLQVMTCHGGVTQLHVTAAGAGVHVCRKAEGRNAFDELLPALAALDAGCLDFRPHADFPGLPTLNIGRVVGGAVASVLTERAEAWIDVRTVPGMTPEGVLADVRARIAAARTLRGTAPDVAVRLRERPGFCQQHPYTVSPDHPVVQAVARAHAAVAGRQPWIGPLSPQVFFGTDASHLSRAGIPTVIYGPGKVPEINCGDESMAVDDLMQAAQVYAMAAADLCARR